MHKSKAEYMDCEHKSLVFLNANYVSDTIMTSGYFRDLSVLGLCAREVAVWVGFLSGMAKMCEENESGLKNEYMRS